MKRILIAIGTRPEAIKLCPILPALRQKEMEPIVCSTGQHAELLEEALRDYGVEPQISFSSMEPGQPLTELLAKLMKGFGEAIRQTKPDCVMVQGDTATAFAGALAAFYESIPVAHIEAGLRTNQIKSPFPEEMQRRAIAPLATYHFVPTAFAKQNLLHEGVDESRIFLVGNTVIDALKYSQSRPVTPEWDLPPRLFPILFTAHRRENFGKPMAGMFRALRRIVESHENVFAICPLHSNPKVREAARVWEGCDRIRVIDPPGPVRFHALLSKCRLVMTDSGGIQEEVTSLGIPTVVMRYSTERMEGVRAGCLLLSGTHEDGIVCAVNALLRPNSELYEQMSHPSDVFGDGKAAEKIAAVLARS
ncbi:MAG: UDP-N-acetylglucosamine 2-epimerase (non-hydrolyzing) [Ruminococcaceae bacterium]|nr:UDP-N-acetylglucosamine 2-epimerase (non-hydrolyzing) [Oscillospiraceae bacterium]